MRVNLLKSAVLLPLTLLLMSCLRSFFHRVPISPTTTFPIHSHANHFLQFSASIPSLEIKVNVTSLTFNENMIYKKLLSQGQAQVGCVVR